LSLKSFSFLHTPWAILIGAFIGVLVGLYNKDFAELISPIGEIYLTLLQLCVLPILISAIVVCIVRLLGSHEISQYLSKMGLVFISGFFIVAIIGVATTMAVSPGNSNDLLAEEGLGKLILESSGSHDMLQNSAYEEVYLSSPETIKEQESLFAFFSNLVPNNIFQALVEGNNLQVLIFSILLGVALGFIKKEKAQGAVDFFDSMFEAFTKVVMALMYLLPFGLCSLLAKNTSMLGGDFLFAIFGLLGVIIGISTIAMIVGFVVLNLRTPHLSTFETLKAIREPIFIAFSTTNSLATIPSSLQALSKEMSYDEEKVALIIPIGITIARFGDILVFAIMTIYMAQLYGLELSYSQIAFVIFGSILAGIATAGAPGEIAVALIAIVLTPLGLPPEIAITILLLANSIIDPFLTTVNVAGNIVATSLVADKTS